MGFRTGPGGGGEIEDRRCLFVKISLSQNKIELMLNCSKILGGGQVRVKEGDRLDKYCVMGPQLGEGHC